MINLVSRNLPFWRHISERKDLGGSQTSIVSTEILHTILLHCSKSASIQYNSFGGLGSITYLSPRPCATMTVEVCLLTAGITIAAGPDIVVIDAEIYFSALDKDVYLKWVVCRCTHHTVHALYVKETIPMGGTEHFRCD